MGKSSQRRVPRPAMCASQKIHMMYACLPERPKVGGADVFYILNEPGKPEQKGYAGHNDLVSGYGVLNARLHKLNTEPAEGTSFLAIGSGDPQDDPQNPPAADQHPNFPDVKQLVTEFARKHLTDATFIDGGGLPTLTPTNVVDFITEFGPGEATGPHIELGLFGGDATIIANSGTLINYITQKVVNKAPLATLAWVFRFTY